MADRPEQRVHRWVWSRFRRRHQALAKQCHTIQRARPDRAIADPPLQILAAAPLDPTDARWRRIAPLLPPEATTGRPARDHRTVLTGILWVIRTGSSWSDIPEAFGPWPTLHRRYRRWCHDGTWAASFSILQTPDHPPPA